MISRGPEEDALAWLETLWGPAGDEPARKGKLVLHTPPIGVFDTGWRYADTAKDRLKLAGRATSVAPAEHPSVYLRCCMLRPGARGRGKAGDSLWLPGLWADLDIAGPAHASPGLPADELAARAIVGHAGLPEPTAWVHSGYGLYPWWLLVEPAELDDRIRDLAQRWGKALDTAARDLGHTDIVAVTGDMARVLRMPGTVNAKVPGLTPVCRVLSDDGPRYTVEALETALSATLSASPGIGAPRGAGEVVGGPLGEGEPCPAIRRDVLDRWIGDPPGPGRRHTAMCQAQTRLARLDEQGHHGAVAALDELRGLFAAAIGDERDSGAEFDTAWRTVRLSGETPEADRRCCGPDLTGVDLDLAFEPGREGGAASPPGREGAGEAEIREFWLERPELTAVLAAARERWTGPWAVLGAVLARVCSRIGPHVMLPPLVGGPGSLNLLVGLVGPSAGGKGSAMAVARALLPLGGRVPTHEVGTGQGIDSTFSESGKDGASRQFCDAALFTIAEIDSLAAHSRMNGANILPTARKVYSGEALGARYADRAKRRATGDHAYRAALVAGIQPARAGVLLDDADGGTPQRWLWLPTNDKATAEGPPATVEDDPFTGPWSPRAEHAADGDVGATEFLTRKEKVLLAVCPTAREAIQVAREAILTADLLAESSSLDGHGLFTRLKVAALLGLWSRGDAEVTEDDWRLAGTIMRVSDATREVCRQALAEGRRRSNTAQARADAERGDYLDGHGAAKAARAILAQLQKADGWLTQGAVRRKLDSARRAQFEAGAQRLLAAGQIEENEGRLRVRP